MSICSEHWNYAYSGYWNNGEYVGSCGELSLCYRIGLYESIFRGWWCYTQEQKACQVSRQASGVEQMVEDGLIEAFASFVVELTPREDQDTGEVGPQHEWPDTDDGF